MEKDRSQLQFLTPEEALAAISLDFDQYGHQPDQLAQIGRLLKIPVLNAGDTDAILARVFSELRNQQVSGTLWARVCNTVFQTAAHPQLDDGGHLSGIWIKHDMANFTCAQCGQCCMHLGYENECTLTDFERWQALGREDILAHVRIIRNMDASLDFCIWIEPGTDELLQVCPWLAPATAQTPARCLIQNVKPAICREYPYTRKHARMTGCRGYFDVARSLGLDSD